MSLTVSVVIPTFKRPESLAACLESVLHQSTPADEVVVVARADDQASLLLVESLPHVRLVTVDNPGQVEALNAGIHASRGAVVAITDDDTVPHTDWVAAIVARFAQSDSVGAVGGRDVVRFGDRVDGGATSKVGRVLWWGRRIGRHHFEAPLQDVHFLKGANMAIRREAWLPFDSSLRGVGAQVCNDFEATWSIHRRGWRVVYDPAVRVDHFPAQRHDPDGRTSRSLEASCNEQHNEAYVVLKLSTKWNRPIQFGYRVLFGTRNAPGLLTGPVWGTPNATTVALFRARLSAIFTSSSGKPTSRLNWKT